MTDYSHWGQQKLLFDFSPRQTQTSKYSTNSWDNTQSILQFSRHDEMIFSQFFILLVLQMNDFIGKICDLQPQRLLDIELLRQSILKQIQYLD